MSEQFHRKPIVWCARCHRPGKTLIFLTDGGHYCWDCAEHMHNTVGLQSAGKRLGDLDPWDRKPSL